VTILFEDDDLIVLNKPAPLPVHASGRFNRNTLRHMLNLVYFPQRPHIVHRLDANTSGVMLLCKRKRVANLVSKQFEKRTVEKIYLTRVHGAPVHQTMECHLALGREPEAGGLRLPDADGDVASTEFQVLQRYADGTTLVRAFPKTGRTNQIRIHLWALGHPIVGDPGYLPDGKVGSGRTLSPDEPLMCLHAKSIRLLDGHGRSVYFEAPDPVWI